MLLDLIKKGVFLGWGVASLTKDKIQSLASEVKKEADLSEEQTHQFQADLQSRVAEARKDLESQIDERIDQTLVQLGIIKTSLKKVAADTTHEFQQFVDRRVDAALERLGIARKEDIEALQNRLALLEAKLAAGPESHAPVSPPPAG